MAGIRPARHSRPVPVHLPLVGHLSLPRRTVARTRFTVLLAVVTLALTGCGSGSPDSPSPVETPRTTDSTRAAGDELQGTQPASASTNVLAATWEDSPYDGTAQASHDLASGSITYDPDNGVLSSTTTFGANPRGGVEAFLLIVLGAKQHDDGCSEGLVLIGSTGSDSVTEWNLFEGGELADSGQATRATSGNSLMLEVEGHQFQDLDLTCAQVLLVDEDSLGGGPTYIFDQTEPLTLTPPAQDHPGPSTAPSPRPPAPSVAATGSLAGTFFWTFESSGTVSGWNNSGVLFIDDHRAFQGIPEAGLTPTCARDGTGTFFAADFEPGCVDYAYDPTTGDVSIGANRGTLSDDGLRVDSLNFYPLSPPAPGTTIDVSLEHKGFSGCAGSPTCMTWTRHLILTEDGQFARSTGTVANSAIAGGTFTSLSHYPPDEHGTYEILTDGRIQFTYANHTVEISTIAFELDEQGRPDPQGTGLLLNDTNFYPHSP